MEENITELIADKKKQINALAAEILVLMDRQVFESQHFVEKDETFKVKIGRKKSDFIEHKVKAGYEIWNEVFVDESTGEKISIERKEMVSINGKRVDIFGHQVDRIEVRLSEVYSDKPEWWGNSQ